MEAIKITRTVEEITGYKAFDGKFFKEKQECEKYENTANAVIMKNFMDIIVRKLEVREVTDDCDAYPFADPGEDWYAALIRIKDENDLHAAQMYQELANKRTKRRFTTDDIGKDLVIVIGWDFDNCYIWGTIDECVECFRKAMMKFYDPEKPEGTV